MREARLETIDTDKHWGYGYVVRVGWLRGKVERDRMRDWCLATFGDDKPPCDWAYDKGGNWYFQQESDAIMFLVAWG